MILKNLSENARSLAANARIEDMSRLIRNHMAGKQDVKNALTGVMVTFFFFFPNRNYFLKDVRWVWKHIIRVIVVT